MRASPKADLYHKRSMNRKCNVATAVKLLGRLKKPDLEIMFSCDFFPTSRYGESYLRNVATVHWLPSRVCNVYRTIETRGRETVCREFHFASGAVPIQHSTVVIGTASRCCSDDETLSVPMHTRSLANSNISRVSSLGIAKRTETPK